MPRRIRIDGTGLSEVMIQDLATVFAGGLRALVQVGVAADLGTLEVVLQQIARRTYGPVLSALLRVQEAH